MLSPSSPLAVSRMTIMEPPNLLEKGDIPQEGKFPCRQVAFYTLIFVLFIISALFSVFFCLLYHKQAPGTCWAHGSLKETPTSNRKNVMSWEWTLKHCDGFVQDNDEYIVIEQSGDYFIYAGVYRKEDMDVSFTLMLCKEPDILLNKAVGLNRGDEKGTVNFGRPFSLQKGDKLYCKGNFELNSVVAGNQTYWGLYKI